MNVYNTLSRRVEVFEPMEPGIVRLYTCGPTVYNYAHIGNYRAYVFEDLLRRALKFFGYSVRQVMNLTDVDDKTIRGAVALGASLDIYTERYKAAFFEDLDTLKIERAELYPEATRHIPEMIALIERLFEKGCAYQSSDGSVYFRIAAFQDYGKLAHLDMSGLRAGARVAQDEYDKDDASDFALWKAWQVEDGDVAWDSPWGRGRPGWHIECSAMSMKYLGETFDIHTGGIDNVFPHHEDEIAQSEAATGKPFVRYWLHCAHLIVEGQKMSKSLGNFFTLRDIIEKGYSGREVRYVLICGHYRQPLDFSFSSLDAARASLARLDAFYARMVAAGQREGALPGWAEGPRKRFEDALAQDLNISESLAAVFQLVHDGNKIFDAGGDLGGLQAVLDLWKRWDSVLGFLQPQTTEMSDAVRLLLDQRRNARAGRNWAESDRIRDELLQLGWEVRDTADGQQARYTG
jgi:cysteinyl-tRNA synthetase